MIPKLSWRVATIKNGFQDALAYRIEFLLEVLGSAAVPVAVQAVLWFAIFKAGGKETFAGQTFSEMMMYTFTSVLFTQVRGGDHDFELQEMIRSGSLSNYLLRPVGVVEFIYLRGVAPKLLISGVCLIAGCLIGPFFGLSPFHLLIAMMLALLGNIIHYQLGAVLATTAFAWEEAYSILMVKNMVVSLLSGEMIPLHLFPENWAWVWKSTPFYLYVYGPTQIALGKWEGMQILSQFVIAFAWMIGCWALIQITWRTGIKRYLSLGG